jgi:hypothetical protein
MGIDGNEMADELAQQGFLHPLIVPEPVLCIATEVAKGGIRDWTSRKHQEYWQSIRGQRQVKGFI